MCGDTKNNTFDCDPKFYITWFGTDAENRPLQSSGLAMSRFRQYSVVDLYVGARDVFNNTIGQIKNTFDDIKNKTEQVLKDIKKAFTS